MIFFFRELKIRGREGEGGYQKYPFYFKVNLAFEIEDFEFFRDG
jgi:hypothetical protein